MVYLTSKEIKKHHFLHVHMVFIYLFFVRILIFFSSRIVYDKTQTFNLRKVRNKIITLHLHLVPAYK